MTEHEPDGRDPIETARDLTGALKAMAAELKAVNKRVARTWHMVWGLVFSLAIDLALTVVVAVFAVQAHNANDNARNARAVAHVAARATGRCACRPTTPGRSRSSCGTTCCRSALRRRPRSSAR